MTGDDSSADPRDARAGNRRRLERADAALDLARSNRDLLAADIADQLEETNDLRARTAYRYAVAEAAYNYALAVHITTVDEARTLRTTSGRTESDLDTAPIPDPSGPCRPARTSVRPIAVSVLPASQVVESGFWALLRKYPGRVTQVPLGPSTDVVVAIVTPIDGARLPPRSAQPMVVIVPDRATADLVSGQGAVAVPMSTNGAQLMAVLETVRTVTPPPHDRRAVTTTHLSGRETEVITLICAGLTNPQIAAELYLGANSVKTYVRTAYKKMGVARRAEAVLWGFRHGYGTTTPIVHEP